MTPSAPAQPELPVFPAHRCPFCGAEIAGFVSRAGTANRSPDRMSPSEQGRPCFECAGIYLIERNGKTRPLPMDLWDKARREAREVVDEWRRYLSSILRRSWG